MLIITFGIIQFGCCWRIIVPVTELVKFIKSKPLSVNGRLGVVYIADRSRHPVHIKPALVDII